ncbi:hypothetical protein A9Q84_16765 [Halobacteriovorax marinus]|uniref:histidine kinase n=1 Tax=Halobacteriovorax marinus TaxID=97084 RepID=A0A1Y5F506_9BACT|nr:hypothetical protein A9Q84_16765 [Halobacteriovorax marinus]
MMALTMGFYTICSYSLVKLYSYSVDDHNYPFKRFSYVFCFSFLATITAHEAGLSFTLISLPMALGVTYPLLYLSFQKILPNWKKVDYFQKMFAIIIILNSIHFLDYPFLRKNPDFASIGFGLAFVFMFVFTIFLPAFVSKFLEKQNVHILEEKVKLRTTELNILKNEKAQLVNILCHDLANPLMIIDMHISNNLKKEESCEKVLKTNKRTKFAIGQIKSMLNQVRQMASVEDGKSNVELSPTNPELILQACRELFTERGDAKGLSLTFCNEIITDSYFLSNHVILVNEILSNFLSNAIKFTRTGGSIALSLEECHKEEKIRIRISDSGLGMNENKIKAILEKNKRTELGTSGEKGTGLGLSVALFYIDKIEGKLDITSRPIETNPNNSGTDITISIDRIINSSAKAS